MEFYLKILFFFFFGACIGSYLNVLIYRLPRELDTVKTRSNCPGCGRLIPWYFNIPIFSYIFLRGRCFYCKFKIPVHYFFVELIIGLASVWLMPDVLRPETYYYYFFYLSIFAVFLSHFIIDYQFKLLPDSLNLYLAFIFFIHGVVFFPWWHWVLGLLIGFGFPYSITWLFYKYSGKVGLGGGDIKLYGALGLFLGPVGVMTNIFMSCFLGSVITLTLIAFKVVKRDDYIPFGPFIIVISFIQVFLPDSFDWVMRAIGLHVN